MKPDMGMGQGLVGCLFLVRESNHKKTQNESYFDLGMTKKKIEQNNCVYLVTHKTVSMQIKVP